MIITHNTMTSRQCQVTLRQMRSDTRRWKGTLDNVKFVFLTRNSSDISYHIVQTVERSSTLSRVVSHCRDIAMSCVDLNIP